MVHYCTHSQKIDVNTIVHIKCAYKIWHVHVHILELHIYLRSICWATSTLPCLTKRNHDEFTILKRTNCVSFRIALFNLLLIGWFAFWHLQCVSWHCIPSVCPHFEPCMRCLFFMFESDNLKGINCGDVSHEILLTVPIESEWSTGSYCGRHVFASNFGVQIFILKAYGQQWTR